MAIDLHRTTSSLLGVFRAVIDVRGGSAASEFATRVLGDHVDHNKKLRMYDWTRRKIKPQQNHPRITRVTSLPHRTIIFR